MGQKGSIMVIVIFVIKKGSLIKINGRPIEKQYQEKYPLILYNFPLISEKQIYLIEKQI